VAWITEVSLPVLPRVLPQSSPRSSHPLAFRVRCPHIADSGTATMIYVDVLDTNELMSAGTQASQKKVLN